VRRGCNRFIHDELNEPTYPEKREIARLADPYLSCRRRSRLGTNGVCCNALIPCQSRTHLHPISTRPDSPRHENPQHSLIPPASHPQASALQDCTTPQARLLLQSGTPRPHRLTTWGWDVDPLQEAWGHGVVFLVCICVGLWPDVGRFAAWIYCTFERQSLEKERTVEMSEVTVQSGKSYLMSYSTQAFLGSMLTARRLSGCKLLRQQCCSSSSQDIFPSSFSIATDVVDIPCCQFSH
jgi:hypothetical protein